MGLRTFLRMFFSGHRRQSRCVHEENIKEDQETLQLLFFTLSRLRWMEMKRKTVLWSYEFQIDAAPPRIKAKGHVEVGF